MIRLLKRRLIIPRGDTGSFSIPTLGEVSEGDIAILGIFDPLIHELKLMKVIYATSPTLTFTFKAEDTANLEAKKYNWDISIYRSPIFDEEGELIGAKEVNTYYSAFKLPICEIKEVALDMCRARWNTRDLLLEAQNPTPPTTYISSIRSVYPWENLEQSYLMNQLYALIKDSGYEGSMEDFVKDFKKLVGEDAEYLHELEEKINEAASKDYVEELINSSGVLKWEIVSELPSPEDAKPNTIYMIENDETGSESGQDFTGGQGTSSNPGGSEGSSDENPESGPGESSGSGDSSGSDSEGGKDNPSDGSGSSEGSDEQNTPKTYKQYILINGVLTPIGDTSIDLSKYIKKPEKFKEDNLAFFTSDGSLKDKNISLSISI